MSFKFKCTYCQAVIVTDRYRKSEVCPSCTQDQLVPRTFYLPNDEIDGYVIDSIIGIGGTGEVYVAHQKMLERKVALKIIRQAKLEDPVEMSRFEREMKNLAKLNHPHIIGAHSAGYFEDNAYLVMRLIDGFSCADYLEYNKFMQPQQALTYILQMAKALQYTWDEFKMLHRDLKPANIMIEKASDMAMLADMGIAKQIGVDNDLTGSDTVIGTPFYISPEQVAGEELDERSDIYGIGATLYHLLCGEAPYDQEVAILTILTKKINEDPIDPREHNPELSDACRDLIMNFMQRDPKKRPVNWAKAILMIEQLISYETKSSRAFSKWLKPFRSLRSR